MMPGMGPSASCLAASTSCTSACETLALYISVSGDHMTMMEAGVTIKVGGGSGVGGVLGPRYTMCSATEM